MSRIGWTLRRLRAMGPAEVAHRLRVALRDRLAPPAYALDTAPQAYVRFFGGAPAAAPVAPPAIPEPALAPVRRAADALMEGRWPLFGRTVELDDPPVWHRNHATGAEWPDISSRKIDYRTIGPAGGAKWTWELGRLTPLPTLACAARDAARRDAAERCARWLADWLETNPFGHGIHHTSGIEMAVRVLTLHWTLALLGERLDEDTRRAALGAMGQQALHCRDHLSLGSSANNHLISEYAAMTLMGAAWPRMRNARALLDQGLAGLERETLKQIHPDGVPAEQAFGYLPFIWELLVLPFAAAEAAGRRIAPEVRTRLEASLAFARDVRLPNGRLPSIGDEDDARILLAEIDAPRADLVGNALAAWLAGPHGAAPGLAHGHDALAWLVAGRAPSAPAPPREGRLEFPHGGYTVWRHGEQLVTFDHGPLGYGSLAAHGHADALAVTVHLGALPLIADPGTFSYHGDRAARDRCRSTPVHATVHFGGRSQSEMTGPFMWGRRANVGRGAHGFVCRWYTGETHERRVDAAPGRVEITDRVHGAQAHVSFPLAPGATVEIDGRTARVEAGGHRVRFTGYQTGPWSVVDSEHAENYGRRAPACRLDARIAGQESKVVFETTPG